jgi:hypothetical protein
MNNPKADAVMFTALGTAAGLGAAGALLFLWACGVSFAGVLAALEMALFISAVTTASPAGLVVGGFLYCLSACGVSLAGLTVALGVMLFVSAISVATTVMVFRSKEQ